MPSINKSKMHYSFAIKGKEVASKVNFMIFTVIKIISKTQATMYQERCSSNDSIIYISASHFFHAVQILNIKELHFTQDAFHLFSLSAIKIVSGYSKGINLKGLRSRCLNVEVGHSV